jgi:uncharacterized membrane protein
MKLRGDIKRQAKANFTNQYGVSIGAYILITLISGAVSGITFGIGALLLVPPLVVGYAYFCIRVYRGERGDIGEMFSAGFNDYGRSLGGILWMYLFTWLWSLLFIIPGIVKYFAYFMTPYILADSRNVSPTDALKIFVMYLSFIGWLLLNAVTFGLLQLLFTGPYMSTSLAGMYLEIRQDALARGVVTPEELF